MKNSYAIIGTVLVVILFSIFLTTSLARPANAQRELPERAQLLGEWIDEKVEARRIRIEERDALETKLKTLEKEISDIETASRDYRSALCAEFHLSRGKDGKFLDLPDCASFQ